MRHRNVRLLAAALTVLLPASLAVAPQPAERARLLAHYFERSDVGIGRTNFVLEPRRTTTHWPKQLRPASQDVFQLVEVLVQVSR